MPDETIRASALFAGLTPEQLQEVGRCAGTARVAQGDRLFREGDPAERFFLLRTGRVALLVEDPARGALTIETIEPDQVVGWSWLFEPYRWHFDGVAVTDVEAVAFDAGCVRALCESDHELGYALMRRFGSVMIERLQRTRLRLLDVYGSRPRD